MSILFVNGECGYLERSSLEHLTFNQVVARSNRARPTIQIKSPSCAGIFVPVQKASNVLE